jgi:hypothetical protein
VSSIGLFWVEDPFLLYFDTPAIATLERDEGAGNTCTNT